MVTQLLLHWIPVPFFAQAEQSGFERLDPVTRTVVVMALLGLVLLGIALIACVMIGGRWVRRLARDTPPSRTFSGRFRRARSSRFDSKVVDASASETLSAVQQTDETRTD